MRRVAVEIACQVIARNDDRIFIQFPSGRFLLSWQKLKARRFDRREVDLLRRVRRRLHDRSAPAARHRERDQERESDSRNAIVTRTPAPVAPRASRAVSCSAYAVPAMSRWAHDGQSTNSFRNNAALIAPPHRPPEFFMSAHSLRIRSL